MWCDPLHRDGLHRGRLQRVRLHRGPLHRDRLRRGPWMHRGPCNRDRLHRGPLQRGHLRRCRFLFICSISSCKGPLHFLCRVGHLKKCNRLEPPMTDHHERIT